jgi:hypothetical protein
MKKANAAFYTPRAHVHGDTLAQQHASRLSRPKRAHNAANDKLLQGLKAELIRTEKLLALA